MNETEPDEPFIQFSVDSGIEKSAVALAAMTGDELHEHIADLFDGIPDDEPQTDVEQVLRESEEDIAAGRVRPFWMIFAEIADEYGFDLPGLAEYRTPAEES